jgi:hypothetical protein
MASVYTLNIFLTVLLPPRILTVITLTYNLYRRQYIVYGGTKELILPRVKGAKTGIRHTPHPLIQVHKQEYVKTLEDFCECIFPRNSLDVAKVLEAVRQKKIAYGKIQLIAEEQNVDQNKFNAIIRRLKDLGIITDNYTFSEVFQNKMMAISTFYGAYTEKANPVQIALNEANEYLKTKGYSGRFEPQFEEDNKGE